MNLEDLKPVKVTWIDSCASNVWTYIDEEPSHNMQCESIGYLIRENNEEVLIALNVGLTNKVSTEISQYGCSICIPRVAVKEIKYLEL